MKKVPLVLSSGKTAQLQSTDWIGPKKNVTNVSPTVSDDNTQGYEPLSKWINTANNKEYTCLISTTGAALWIEITSVHESSNLVFWPSAPAESGPVYKTWANLMTAIGALSEGVVPVITFRENFTIPSLGMPVGGWDMRRGKWQSPVMATGLVQVTVPDGVIIDNLLGGIDSGLVVEFQPTTSDGCLTFTSIPNLNIFQVGFGAKVVNTGTKALILSSGTGDVNVIVLNGATIGIPPNDTAPWLKIQGTDGVIALAVVGGIYTQFPNDWLTGGSPGSSLTYQFNVGSITPTLASWTGDAPNVVIAARAGNVSYDDSLVPVPSLGSTVQAALDAIKPLLGGGGGGTERIFIFDPTGTPAGNVYDDMDALLAAGASVNGRKTILVRDTVSPTSPVVVPVGAGAYNFSDYVIESANPSDMLQGGYVSFADGVTISNFFEIVRTKLVFNNTASIVWTFAGSSPIRLVRLETYGVIENLGSVQVINPGIGATLQFAIDTYGAALLPTNYEIFNMGHGTATLAIAAISKGPTTFISGTDFVRGTNGTVNILLFNGDEYGATNANFTGTLNAIEYNYKSAGGGGGTNYGNTVIYDPDIAATNGNRFKTWAEVMSAIAATPFNVYTQLLIHKPGIFQSVTVPAGTYDLSKVILSPTPGTVVPTLNFADGTTLSGFPQRVEGVQIRNNNTTAPLFTVSGFAICQLFDASLVNGAAATQPAWLVPNASSATLQLQGLVSPIFKLSGGSEPIEVQGSLSIDVTRGQSSAFFSQIDIFTNQTSGNGTITITSYVLLPGGYTGTHANYDGTLNINQREEARVNELIDLKAPHTSYLFDPNASPSAGVFTDFSELMTAVGLATTTERKVIIYFNTISAYSVPVGVYDFRNCIFKDVSRDNNISELSFADGCEIAFWPIVFDILMTFANTTDPVSTASGGMQKEVRMNGRGRITNNGSQNVLLVASSADSFLIEMHDESELMNPNAPVVKANASGATIVIVAFGYANWNGPTGVIDSVSGSVITIYNYTLRPGGYGIAANYGAGTVTFEHKYENRVLELSGFNLGVGGYVAQTRIFNTEYTPNVNRATEVVVHVSLGALSTGDVAAGLVSGVHVLDGNGGDIVAKVTNVAHSITTSEHTLNFKIGANKNYQIEDFGDIPSSIVVVREMTV